MSAPRLLQAGDTIAITCPSGYFPHAHATCAQEALESWGFRVVMGQTVGSEYYYFSAPDELRLRELQGFLDDPDVSAIFMGRGGYGLSRIIDRLDFTEFRRQPKWINGFSDITVLHSHLQALMATVTIHGPMCNAFREKDPSLPHLTALRNALTGNPISYPVSACKWNKAGIGQGVLTGGNLAILAHLSGSVSVPAMTGKILFIEEVGEYLYQIDRMLLTLKRAGWLDQLAGLVCGGFTEIKDTARPFGQDIYEIVLDKVSEYDFPVCFDFPAGHLAINYPLLLGRKYELVVTEETAGLSLLPSV